MLLKVSATSIRRWMCPELCCCNALVVFQRLCGQAKRRYTLAVSSEPAKETLRSSFRPALYRWIWGSIFTSALATALFIFTYVSDLEPTLRFGVLCVLGTLIAVGIIWLALAYH